MSQDYADGMGNYLNSDFNPEEEIKLLNFRRKQMEERILRPKIDEILEKCGIEPKSYTIEWDKENKMRAYTPAEMTEFFGVQFKSKHDDGVKCRVSNIDKEGISAIYKGKHKGMDWFNYEYLLHNFVWKDNSPMGVEEKQEMRIKTDDIRSEHQQRVDQFMRLAGQDVPDAPLENPSDEVRILRAKLIFEEVLETIRKGLGVEILLDQSVYSAETFIEIMIEEKGRPEQDVKKRPLLHYEIAKSCDLIETIDGCCDIMVVTTGTLSALGIPDVPFQREVDENNLAKFGPGGYRADGTDASPGPKGKWIKPPGHKPPDIEGILKQMEKKSPSPQSWSAESMAGKLEHKTLTEEWWKGVEIGREIKHDVPDEAHFEDLEEIPLDGPENLVGEVEESKRPLDKEVSYWATAVMNLYCKFEDVPEKYQSIVRELCKIELDKPVMPITHKELQFNPPTGVVEAMTKTIDHMLATEGLREKGIIPPEDEGYGRLKREDIGKLKEVMSTFEMDYDPQQHIPASQPTSCLVPLKKSDGTIIPGPLYLILRLDGDTPDGHCARMAARMFAIQAWQHEHLRKLSDEISQKLMVIEESMPPLKRSKEQ